MQRRAIIGALLLIGVGVVLGTTVFRADIAQATGLAQSVTVNNTATNPVPVAEQNLDGSNIRVHEEGTADVKVTNSSVPVHEQGTADVNVTNASLSVSAPAPVTGGGGSFALASGSDQAQSATASALAIHMGLGVGFLRLSDGASTVAEFRGPALEGTSDVVLSLTRPITFDHILCAGGVGYTCSVSFVGNIP
jgi:hypothetical protein